MDFLIENEQVIRVSVFISLLLMLGGAELIAPLAKRQMSRPSQWFTNLSIVLLDNLTLKYLFPLLAVGVAELSAKTGVGLFNALNLNFWLEFGLALFFLDFLMYGQHVLMHKVPILWRLHRMHHSEISLDVSSAVRFHPIEIIFSMLFKMGFILMLGISVEAVIVFEILLNGLALFNHSNLKLSRPFETILRKIIVTPEIHWIHHSEVVQETKGNFGFNLIFWDKIFGTYIDKPTLNYDVMQQGLSEFGFARSLSLTELIVSPFKNYPPCAPADKNP